MDVLTRVEPERLRSLRSADRFFWLDLRDPSDAELEAIGAELALHPAAVEDSREWSQIPKLDDYGEHLTLVAFAGNEEVHLHVSGSFVVTVSRSRTPLDSLHEWLRATDADCEDEILYHILDALMNAWDPITEDLDRRVDVVEDAVLERVRHSQLRAIHDLRQEAVELARRAVPQCDVLDDAVDAIHALPGLTRGSREWMRDVTTHAEQVAHDLERIAGDVRALADTFFNANANRLNRIATLFTVGGTFFLVWTLVTSFFGQNFDWLVDNVDSRSDFLVFGVGGLLVPTLVLGALFWWRRRDWW